MAQSKEMQMALAAERQRASAAMSRLRTGAEAQVEKLKSKMRERTEMQRADLVYGALGQLGGAGVGSQIRRKFAKDEDGKDTIWKVRVANYVIGFGGGYLAATANTRAMRIAGMAATGAGVYQFGRDMEDFDLVPFDDEEETEEGGG